MGHRPIGGAPPVWMCFRLACKGADDVFSRLFAKLAANPDPTTIGRDALAAELKSGACVVVDVREPHEYAAGHIPGAVNQPLSRFDPGRLPAGKPVVLVCKSGARSAGALRRASMWTRRRPPLPGRNHGLAGARRRGRERLSAASSWRALLRRCGRVRRADSIWARPSLILLSSTIFASRMRSMISGSAVIAWKITPQSPPLERAAAAMDDESKSS